MVDTVQSSDAALVRACQAGDKAPFCCLVERYYTLACAVAFAATGSAEASRDVAQDAFVTAWLELPKLRNPARFRSWLCGIVRNTAHYQRRHRRRHAPEAREPLAAVDGAVQAPSAHAELERRERLRLVEDALARLPASYREPLVLFYWGGHTVEQVARELELSDRAVRQRLCRGRRRLEQHVRGLVEDALAGARPQREGVAVAVIAAIVAAERQAAAVAAGAAGGWLGAGLVEALIGMVALTAVVLGSVWQAPSPLPSPAVPSAVAESSAVAVPPARAIAAREAPPSALPARPIVAARRAPLRARPRGVVSHGLIEIERVPEPRVARIELPLIEMVSAAPRTAPTRRELAPPALDLMRDLDEL